MLKRIFLLAITISTGLCNAYGQASFNTIDSLNVNNLNAAVLVHGDMWWNPVTQEPACEFPKGSKKHINFASSLWIGGYDAGNNLHVAAQTYRQSGNDYWPGPLDASDTLTYATSANWAKIWKLNRVDIQNFQTLPTHTVSNTHPTILTWPGKGNVNAAGNAGAALTITTNMAPFVDLNSNGIYEPLAGEYPDIKGDQALWWVFSDNGPVHTETNGKPLGVEIHAMAYGYKRGSLIDNVIYYDYTVVNKSANNYHDFRVAMADNADLGFYLDDFIGFDSAWRMGITYNATGDDGGSAGHPINSYGTNLPITGLTMIVLPGDVGTSYVPAGSFTYYNNDASIIGNPVVDSHYNNYLRAKLKNGQHFTKAFSPAVPCISYGSGPDYDYVYTGNPSIITEWSECACANNPGDRRFTLASNDFTLNAGSTAHIVMALVATDTNQQGCGTGANFNAIRIVADTAWKDYFNPLPILPYVSVNEISKEPGLNIYPNPAQDKLFIEGVSNTGNETIAVYNTLGQLIKIEINRNGNKLEANISNLPTGLYYVLYRNTNGQTAVKFVKD